MSAGEDPDSTLAWLRAPVPAVPNYPASDDDSEEEVFFGPRKSHRELHGKNAKVVGRPTLYPTEIASTTQFTSNDTIEEEERPESDDDQHQHLREEPPNSAESTSHPDDDSENIPPTPGVEPPPSPWSRHTNTPSRRSSPLKSNNKKGVSISPLKPEMIEFSLGSSSFSSSSGQTNPTKLQSSSISPLADRSMNQSSSWDRSRSPLNRKSEEPGQSVQPTDPDEVEEAQEELGELPSTTTMSPPLKPLEMSLNSSTASEWFNNTHDEHILYERFGEDYDQVVAKMDNEEKRALKREIAHLQPKSILELLGEELLAAEMDGYTAVDPPAFDESLQIESEPVTHHPQNDQNLEEQEVETEPVTSQHNPRISLKPPTPKPRTLTPQKRAQEIEDRTRFRQRLSDEVKDFSPRLVQSSAALKLLKEDLALALSPTTPAQSSSSRKTKNLPEQTKTTTPRGFGYPQDALITPTTNEALTHHHHYGTYTKSSSGSKKPITLAQQPADEMFKTPNLVTPQKSASVQRRERMGFNTPSIHRTPSYLRPTSASKRRASPKKDPITKETLEVSMCPRHGYATSHHEEVNHMACHASLKTSSSSKKLPSSIDMRKIVSPVGEYIKRHPVPPIQRQIKPLVRSNQRAIAQAIAEEASAGQPSPMPEQRQYAALPEAVYRSARIALEKPVADGARPGIKLPKSFGKVEDVEALVIRHVGRERIPSNVRLEMPQGRSEGTLKDLENRGVIRTYDRESMAPQSSNESMLEMSIREVKKIYLGDDRPV